MNKELKHKLIRSGFILFVFILFVFMFKPFFTAILLASLFAFALHDVVNKMTTSHIKRPLASLIIISGLLVFIAAPLSFVVIKTISSLKYYSASGLQNTSLYKSTETLLHSLTSYSTTLAESLNLDLSKLPKPVELLSNYADSIAGFATNTLTKVPQLTLSFFVFFLALYYFLNDSSKIKNLFLRFDLLSELETNKIINIIKRSSYLTLFASVLIGSIQATIITTVAYFCGFNDFIIVFIVTFITSLIPVVGSAPIALFLMLILFIQGNSTAGVAMLLASATSGGIDNLIKPLILNSSNEDLHPILSLLALIGAILVYGPVGILLGPILTQLTFNILSILATEEKSSEIALIEG